MMQIILYLLKALMVLSLNVICPFLTQAQTSSTFTANQSGLPSSTALLGRQVSFASGYFSLNQMLFGKFRLLTSSPEHTSYTSTVTIRSEQIIMLNTALTEATTEIEEDTIVRKGTLQESKELSHSAGYQTQDKALFHLTTETQS